ncbi:hypothetical protein IIC44_02765 [Patescibacteria group bacterium]|nr:hypothetical protein [Patescibacteria group bacterium]
MALADGKVTKVGKKTLLQQIITMVEDAQTCRAPIQNLVDKISEHFPPTVIILSVLVFVRIIINNNKKHYGENGIAYRGNALRFLRNRHSNADFYYGGSRRSVCRL